ncbi:MAG TPA: glycosyltransferase family 2 protein [Pseudolysinimonas sp.]|nr:glycosyltransferase family 2 protein [Pseudolysinimonas sp.]
MVSVVLCTHNGAQYVGEQVASILQQVPAPTELVLGDDASTDDTVAIVERLAADAGVQLVLRRHDPALGVRANFADALDHATGELIALSDQDDIWHEGKLSTLIAAFAADPDLLLVHSDARLVDADGRPLGLTLLQALEATAHERAGLERGDAFATLMRRNLVTGATVMVRRSLLERAAPFAPDWVHDEWLAVIAAATGKLRLLPAELIDYRQHGANQIGARKPTWAERWAKLREPREPRASGLVARTAQLVEALERLGDGVAPSALAAARARLDFENARRALSRVPVARLPWILAAAVRGRYGRYARGSIDILRDLVQPPGGNSP